MYIYIPVVLSTFNFNTSNFGFAYNILRSVGVPQVLAPGGQKLQVSFQNLINSGHTTPGRRRLAFPRLDLGGFLVDFCW